MKVDEFEGIEDNEFDEWGEEEEKQDEKKLSNLEI